MTLQAPPNEQPVTTDDLLWQQLKSLPAFRALLRAVEARFYPLIPLPEPTLDVGCGDGHFAAMTFPGRTLAAGIDPWWGPLHKAVQSGKYGLPIQALGDRLPFADGAFASAFSNSVLEHIPDLPPVLAEVNRVLRPGARFVITTPSHLFTEYLGGRPSSSACGWAAWHNATGGCLTPSPATPTPIRRRRGRRGWPRRALPLSAGSTTSRAGRCGCWRLATRRDYPRQRCMP